MKAAPSKKSAILESITHYLTAIVVILKGIDKIDTPGKIWAGIVFLFIGILIVAGTLFHHKAEKLLKHFKAYVFALEALVMSIVGVLYMKEGKQFIQYACFATVLGFIIALVVYIRKNGRKVTETHFS